MPIAALKVQLVEMTIYLSKTAQIIDIEPLQVFALKQNKASIKIEAKYSDFSDDCSEKEVLVLPEQTAINVHFIKVKRNNNTFMR